MTNVKALRQRLAQTDALLWRSYRALARVKRQRDAYREQLRQDHPGMAAHLPPTDRPQHVPLALRWRVGRSQPHNVYLGDVHHLVVLGGPPLAARLAEEVVAVLNADTERRARVVGGTDGPDQGDPAAWLGNPFVWVVTPMEDDADQGAVVTTWDTLDEAQDFHRAYDEDGTSHVLPLYEAPGAVAAAPPGDEEAIERATDDASILSRPSFWPLADDPMRGRAARVSALIDAGWRLAPPAPPAGHEDEAAVERAARAAYAAFNGEEMPAQSIRLGQWRSVARAALAASRGPRTPDPGASA